MSSPSRQPLRVRILLGVALLAAALTLLMQFRVLQSVRRENDALRTQVRQLRGLEQDRLELQRLRTHLAEPDRMRRNILELHRLRREVEALRAGKAVGGARDQAVVTGTNATVLPGEEVAPLVEATKEDWGFRGFETPEATLETILWAGRENRVDVFLDSFVPEIRQEFEAAMAEIGVTPELDAEDGPIAQATGLRVLAVVPMGPEAVEVHYAVGGWREGQPFRQPLRHTEAGWKFSGDPENLD